MSPQVSIILPNYNHAPFLQERLDSILNQTFQNFELIILDDASTDDRLSILYPYKNHEKVSHFVVNKNNTGSPFIQWKRGLEMAKGELIWIAESDDSCAPNFLEEQVKVIDMADVVVAKTKVLNKVVTSKIVSHPAFREKSELVLENDSIFYCPALNVSAVVFRKPEVTALQLAQFSDFKIIGDRVFYFEFFQHKKWHYHTATESYFRQEGTGLSSLETKGISYLNAYFREHVRYILYANTIEKGKLQANVKPYIQRFFNRVRNRVPGWKKLSFGYLSSYLYYKSLLKKY